jgi:type IV pilus assembly protein PilE
MKSVARHRGFTLIELMIVVAVIGILASLAYPSYREQIAKGQRASAKSVISEAQQWMGRFYSENYRYDSSLANVAITDATLFPAQFSTAPRAGEGTAAYNITVTATVNAYTVTAVPTAVMTNDKCGSFNITHTGRKSVTNYSTTVYSTALAAARDCWR